MPDPKKLSRFPAVRLSLILGLSMLFSVLGCVGPDDPAAKSEKTQTKQSITPEQARAALLELKSIRVISGGEDDPVFVNLKTGAITWTSGSTVNIGSFISCNLNDRTWKMEVGDGARFHASANGTFERQSDGTWRAIQTGGSISMIASPNHSG